MTVRRLSPLAVVAAATAAALACGESTSPPESPVIDAVVAGNGFTCALDRDGAAYCWGRNDEGQLGRGATSESGGVGPVTGDVAFTALAAGDENVCGLVGSRAYCWGAGPLFNATDPVVTPTAIEPANPSFASLSVGGQHACGLTSAGAAWCWGNNGLLGGGQLGNGTVESSAVATQVVGGIFFDALSAGFIHTCGLAGGDVWCWGSNYEDALGVTDVLAVAEPTQAALAVSASSIYAGAGFNCVGAAGTTYCWGTNGSGQLGRTTAGPADDVAQPIASSPALFGLAAGPVNRTVTHACALDTDGRALCWGANDELQLGRATGSTCAAGPTDIDCGLGPNPVSTDLRFDQVTVGADHTCALAAGVVYCWGANDDGQLGFAGGRSGVPVEVVIEADVAG